MRHWLGIAAAIAVLAAASSASATAAMVAPKAPRPEQTLNVPLGAQTARYTLPDGYCIPSPAFAKQIADSFPASVRILALAVNCDSLDREGLPLDLIMFGQSPQWADVRADRKGVLDSLRTGSDLKNLPDLLLKGFAEGASGGGAKPSEAQAALGDVDDDGAFFSLNSDLTKAGLTIHVATAVAFTVVARRLVMIINVRYSGDVEDDKTRMTVVKSVTRQFIRQNP